MRTVTRVRDRVGLRNGYVFELGTGEKNRFGRGVPVWLPVVCDDVGSPLQDSS